MADLSAFFDSDSDESEFSGFSESDLDDSSGDLSDGSDSSVDDDGVGNANVAADWTQNFSNLRFNDFIDDAGPNLPDGFDTATATPIQYFWLLFQRQLLASIVGFTNAYAAWKMATTGTVDDKWVDTDEAEMKAFLGINILMGICELPQVSMYWSANNFIGNVGVASTMTCNRFQKLLQYLHVSDRASEPTPDQPNYDKLFKVRPVIDSVSETFRTMYTLSREVSVDEAMIAFTGRLSYRQYMPAKPIKRGVKVWMLCDARTAFLSRFDIYLGRQNNVTEHGLGYNVVMKLTDHVWHTFRWIFFDNFFTSVVLLKKLLEKGLYACGTVRPNRKGFPDTLKKPRDIQNCGDFRILQYGHSNLTASVWKDKRLVYHLSTLSRPNHILQAQRRVGRNILNVRQPHSVHSYNQYMGGVDRHDQLRAKYDDGRQSKKYWRYIFWFLLNCSVVNAYLLYKLTSQRSTKKKRYSHLDFRLELVKELISGFNKRKRSVGELQQEGPVEIENMNGHTSSRLPGKKRRCKYHSRVLKSREETVYGCSVCNVHLCRNGCFARYHNM